MPKLKDNKSIAEPETEKEEEKISIKDEDQSESFDQTTESKPSNPETKTLNLDAYDFYKNYDPSKNVYDPWLTVFERTAILGVRATQLENNAAPLVDVPEGVENVFDIAEQELKAGKLPLILCREGHEYWRVADLADNA